MLHGKNHGFTLAEVLITLGVIGVVAAITLPNVIQNYQKKVASTRIKKAYTNLNKAIKMSEAQNEELKFWDFPTGTPTVAKTRDFVDKYIKPYFVDLKECSSGKDDSCGFWISQAGVNYLTTNGTGIAILVGKNNTLIILIDINGKNKPNIQGKDMFMFSTQNSNKLMPYGWKEGLSKDEILNGYNYTSKNAFGETKTFFISCKPDNEGDEYSRHACIDLLMLNNWEMDKDYPW